jgi:hypothetical protein
MENERSRGQVFHNTGKKCREMRSLQVRGVECDKTTGRTLEVIYRCKDASSESVFIRMFAISKKENETLHKNVLKVNAI